MPSTAPPFTSRATPARPMPTPMTVRALGRPAPRAQSASGTKNGVVAISRAATPEGSRVCAVASNPWFPAKKSVPTSAEAASSLRVGRCARRARPRPSMHAPPTRLRPPMAKAGGTVSTDHLIAR